MSGDIPLPLTRVECKFFRFMAGYFWRLLAPWPPAATSEKR